jgi:hypothetical protein
VRTGVPVAMLGIQRGGNCVEGSVHPRSDPGVLFAHVAAGSLLSGMEHSATLTVHCEDSAECASSAWCSDTGAIPNGPMRAGDAEDGPCVYALLLRSVAEGGEACVEGGGQCPNGGEGFFDRVQNERRRVGHSVCGYVGHT